MEGMPPRDSWRQKERLLVTLEDERNASQRLLETKGMPLETLGDKKNDFQRLLETKGTPPGGKMDFWKQLIRNPPVNHKI
ncbi:unnamed protein product [Rhizophagus irregularis]|uniref:Uncharacterized protein n=1 Tax=Rhizophagus irregularis TaxID=588596 RepID=A0A916EA08_9GLOM|nr:unnamed protein product [Rhizophagus irregularis]